MIELQFLLEFKISKETEVGTIGEPGEDRGGLPGVQDTNEKQEAIGL